MGRLVGYGVSQVPTNGMLGGMAYQDPINVTVSSIAVAAGSTSEPSISPSGDSNTGIFFPSADTVAFGEGGAEALRINSSGRVGIGTDMGGSPASNYGFGVYRASGTGYLYTETAQAGASAGLRAKAGTADFTIFTTQGTGQLAVYDNTNTTERLRIDSSGNITIPSNGTLGINGATPQAPLDVISNSSSYALILRGRTADNQSMIRFSNNAYGNVYSEIFSGATFLATTVGGTERFRIGSSGQLGIGGANYGSSGQVLTSQGSGSAPQWATPAGGKVLQVQSSVKSDYTDQATSANTWYNISGLSVNITPSSSSSRVFVIVDVQMATGQNGGIRLLRNGSAIALGNSYSSRTRMSAAAADGQSIEPVAATISYLDSPGTTSTVTYSIQGLAHANGGGSGGSFKINSGYGNGTNADYPMTISTITVFEIGS